jgi:hypothetical protein
MAELKLDELEGQEGGGFEGERIRGGKHARWWEMY